MTHRELNLGERPSGALSAPPKPVPDVDVRRLPLEPEEAFVWSRVDGRAELQEIAWSTGLTAPVVERALRKLASVGAITWPAARSKPSKPAPHSVREQSASANTAASSGVPSEPEPPSGLGVGREAYVQTLYDRIQQGDLDYYQLLGVSSDASKQQIKSAYFKLVAEVHPDRYFGEELGEMRLRLTTVFEHLTKAHDTLTRSRQRAEYDAYLSARNTASRTPAPHTACSPAPNGLDAARAADPVAATGSVSTNAKE